jgi:hypothetical protein
MPTKVEIIPVLEDRSLGHNPMLIIKKKLSFTGKG